MSKEQTENIREELREMFMEEKGKGNTSMSPRYITEQLVIRTRVRYKQPTVEYHLNAMVGAGVLNVRKDGKMKMYSMARAEFPEITDINWAPSAQMGHIVRQVKAADGQMTFSDAMMAMRDGSKVMSNVTEKIYRISDGRIVDVSGVQIWPEINEMNNLWSIATEVPPCPICHSRAVVTKDKDGWYCQCMNNTCQARMKSFPTRAVACEQFKVKEVKE